MMSDKVVQFGPLTPQELDAFVHELQLKNIPFEIHKDEETEKKFKRIDFANIVNQVEFRTEQYLAQIFYITLAKQDLPRISAHLEKLGFPTELPESEGELQTDETEDRILKATVERNKFNRRLLAWGLIIGLLCLIFMSYGFKILSES